MKKTIIFIVILFIVTIVYAKPKRLVTKEGFQALKNKENMINKVDQIEIRLNSLEERIKKLEKK